MAGFVGVQLRARRYDLGDEGNAIGFLPGNRGHGAALTLASHDDDAALARLVLRQPAVNAVLLEVRWPDVPADVGAIHLHGAGERRAGHFAAHRLTKLVAEHESRSVLHIEVPAELQGADTL